MEHVPQVWAVAQHLTSSPLALHAVQGIFRIPKTIGSSWKSAVFSHVTGSNYQAVHSKILMSCQWKHCPPTPTTQFSHGVKAPSAQTRTPSCGFRSGPAQSVVSILLRPASQPHAQAARRTEPRSDPPRSVTPRKNNLRHCTRWGLHYRRSACRPENVFVVSARSS